MSQEDVMEKDIIFFKDSKSMHYTVSGYDSNGNKVLRPKIGYDSEIKAQELCFFLNTRKETIHKAVAYRCPTCGKWHIGHHKGKELNDTDKAKIMQQWQKWKIINKKYAYDRRFNS